MIDSYGREIDYIRISITDRCNLRCVYCMPECGVESVSHDNILRYNEILSLGEIFAELGIKKIKITGGEPLVRKGAPSLIRDLKRIPGIEKVTITTNGVNLEECAEELSDAGIDGINLSLDTLDPEVFFKITRRNDFEKVMRGFRAVLDRKEISLKINCVPVGIEGQNIFELAELSRKYPVHVRYIEMMPIGLGKEYTGCTEDEILRELEARYGTAVNFSGKLGNGPGHYYEFPGFQGKIGFISAMSHKFCSSCNRVRLTSEGYLKTCLQYDVGTDLRALLRGGAPKEEIKEAIQKAIQEKPRAHQFTEKQGGHGEQHMMSQIGG